MRPCPSTKSSIFKFAFTTLALLIFSPTQKQNASIFTSLKLFAEAVPSMSPTTVESSPPSMSPSALPTTTPPTMLEPETESAEAVTMTLTGVNPLSQEDLAWFQQRTQDFILDYYNEETLSCTICLQNDIDVDEVTIKVFDQDPRFGGINRLRQRRNLRQSLQQILFHDSNTFRKLQTTTDSKVTLTYSQTTSYRKINSELISPIIEEIVQEPFNNIAKRKTYIEFIKEAVDVPLAFSLLNVVSAPTIKEIQPSFFGIGVIAAIAAGGLVVLIMFIFLICRCRRRNKNDSKYGNDDRNVLAAQSRKANGHGRHPSQVHLPDIKDEVSTMVDPSPQYGVFSSGAKSLEGFNNTASVASFDPDYNGIYGGGADDPSLVSSAGGTMGSQTQKSKFSAMESILTPGQAASAHSVFTDDEQSFENHMQSRRNGRQREEYFDIYAPGGKLGVVIDTPNNGAPVVHNIKDTCPIADQLMVGDKLIAVDDEDVRSMTAVKVSKLISQKSNNPTRKFTIARAIKE